MICKVIVCGDGHVGPNNALVGDVALESGPSIFHEGIADTETIEDTIAAPDGRMQKRDRKPILAELWKHNQPKSGVRSHVKRIGVGNP